MLQGELDADKAVAIAMVNNPRLQVVLGELGIARADLIEASTIRNPIAEAELRFPASPFRPFEVLVTQTLVDLFLLPRRRAVGKATFEAEKLRVTAEVIHLGAEVRESFYDLVATLQRVGMERTIVESTRTSAELARRMNSVGNLNDLDLENEQARYEEAKLDLARGEENALVRREKLLREMGLRDRMIDWRAREDFPPLADRELSQEEIDASLVSRRLDIAIAQREVEAAKAALPIARTSVVGDISVGGHQERESDGTKTTGPSIQLPIPIFNRGRAGRTRAEARLAQAEQRLVAVQAEAGSEIRAVRARLLSSRARVEYYRDVLLPRRRRIVELTSLQYNAMLFGLFQLLQAKQNEINARHEYIEAQLDYWKARSDFDLVVNGVGGTEEDNRSRRSPLERRTMADESAIRGGSR